jgi:AcrR family transcriptional regulator
MRQDTKERLLDAARGLFAERGFHNATVREIAARAQTNLASINYHFRSKDDLYREVMRHSFRKLIKGGYSREDLHALAAAGDDPEERLHAFIRIMLPDPAGEGGGEEHMRLIAWEMLSPTGAMDDLDETELRPHLELAEDVVRPFLAANASATDTTATALWLIGQCVIFRHLAARARAGFKPVPLDGEHGAHVRMLIARLALHGLGDSQG